MSYDDTVVFDPRINKLETDKEFIERLKFFIGDLPIEDRQRLETIFRQEYF